MMCFVDTSALFAVLDAADPDHARAESTLSRLREDQIDLLTTNYVVLEAIVVAQRRIGLDAVRVLETLLLPGISLHWIDETTHQDAISALLVAGRRQLSLVDCTSFVVMRRLDIADVFAFDPHFAEQGFRCHPG
jgi:predicted nucleic acid-binding protein